MIKKQIQTVLSRVGLHQRLRFSFLYDVYWGIADRSLLESRDQEIEFFRRTLVGFKPGDIIFDVGANLGHKTGIFLRLGARVVAVEPDRSNQEILKQSFLQFRIAKKAVTIVDKAVSDHTGTEIMFVDEAGSAKNTLNKKWVDTLRADSTRFGKTLDFTEEAQVETITVEELIETQGRPFYMKIDVEGYEPAVLRGLRTPIPYVSFEVNLPEFLPEARECIELLEGVAANGGFNYAADCTRGFDLPAWQPMDKFLSQVEACKAPCIEIFWRAPRNER